MSAPAISRRHCAAYAAIVIDTLGAGAFYPLTLLYLIAATGFSAERAAVTVTLGSMAAFPAGPFAGSLLDRWGARRVLVGGNLLSAAGYALLLSTVSYGQVLAALALIGIAERCFWSSWNLFVAERVPSSELDAWYGRLNAVRAASLGVGAMTATAAVALGALAGMRAMLALNIASSLAAGWLYTRDDHHEPVSRPVPEEGERAARNSAPKPSWRIVLRDRPYLVMTAAQTALCFAWLIPAVVLPLYLTSTKALPTWLPSSAVAVNTAFVVVAQTAVTRRVEKYRRTLAIAGGSLLILTALAMLAVESRVGGRTLAVMAVLLAIVIFTLGELIIEPAAAVLSVTAAPPELRGRYSSLYQMSWTLSSMAGPTVIALLLAAGVWCMWGALLALTVVGGACYALLTGRLAEYPVGEVTDAQEGTDVRPTISA
jgi:MFS family permease